MAFPIIGIRVMCKHLVAMAANKKQLKKKMAVLLVYVFR
jgi:hypothetical protein